MEKEFIPFEKAVKLKELGFDKPCYGYYDHQIKELDTISSDVCERLCKHDTHIKAPTFSQAFKWFREKYGLKFHIREDQWNNWCTIAMIEDGYYVNCGEYETYDTTELECLKKLIEIVESK